MQRLSSVARFLLPVSAPGGCLWLSLTTRTVFAIGVNLQSAGWLRRGSSADGGQAGWRNGLLQSELACRRGGGNALRSLRQLRRQRRLRMLLVWRQRRLQRRL